MSQKRRRSDFLLGEDIAKDLPQRSANDLREIRKECEEAEARLSYDRRILQGKIDILKDELDRREQGGSRSLSELREAISDIFASDIQTSGRGALLRDPVIDSDEPRRRKADRLVDDPILTSLPEMDLDDISRLISELAIEEQALSEKRRVLHGNIDALRAEVTRRYKTGELGVEALLHKGSE